MRTRWLDDEGEPLTPSRLTRLDLAVVALSMCSNILHELGSVASTCLLMVQAHNNYLVEQDEFAHHVLLSIESLSERVEEDG